MLPIIIMITIIIIVIISVERLLMLMLRSLLLSQIRNVEDYDVKNLKLLKRFSSPWVVILLVAVEMEGEVMVMDLLLVLLPIDTMIVRLRHHRLCPKNMKTRKGKGIIMGVIITVTTSHLLNRNNN